MNQIKEAIKEQVLYNYLYTGKITMQEYCEYLARTK